MARASVRALAIAIAAASGLTIAQPAAAARPDYAFVLPDATSAEGIASGPGSTFYAGDLVAGDIFRGDVRTGAVEKFIDNEDGRMAVGLKADVANKLLFVAGGSTGQGYVYSTRTGETVTTYQFATGPSFINDVTLTAKGAWFTDSVNAVLYFVPVRAGVPGTVEPLELTGPAADVSGQFNNNGIAATAGGSALLVAHSGQGAINVVDSRTGASQTVAGVRVPNVDGILVQGRTLYAVRNFDNKIVRFQLSGDLRTGRKVATMQSELFQVPTTVALFGDRLAAVNSKFDTGVPPTADEYEVVVIERR